MNRNDFISSLTAFKNAAARLSDVWMQLEGTDENHTESGYPFGYDFQEVTHDISKWLAKQLTIKDGWDNIAPMQLQPSAVLIAYINYRDQIRTIPPMTFIEWAKDMKKGTTRIAEAILLNNCIE